MRYRIYKLTKPSHLQTTEPDGYSVKTIEKCVLEIPEYYSGIDDDFSSVEEAENAIRNNSSRLKCQDLCILPVVSVTYDGEII